MKFVTSVIIVIILIGLYMYRMKSNANINQNLNIEAKNAQTAAIQRDKERKEQEKIGRKKFKDKEKWVRNASKLLKRHEQKFYSLDMIASELGEPIPEYYIKDRFIKNGLYSNRFIARLQFSDSDRSVNYGHHTYDDTKTGIIYYYYGELYEG